jgi:hypothetical protein
MNLIPLKVALLRAPLFPFERLEKLLEDENTVPFAIAVFSPTLQLATLWRICLLLFMTE